MNAGPVAELLPAGFARGRLRVSAD